MQPMTEHKALHPTEEAVLIGYSAQSTIKRGEGGYRGRNNDGW